MRIAVLSDIHSNLVALDAVLADAGDVDGIWQLGDVVGYGPDPDGVVGRLAERGARGVRGNHDSAALGGLEIEWFNPEARQAVEWTRDHIQPATAAWLSAQPERLTVGDWSLVHGSPRDPMREYVTSTDIAEANIDVLPTTHGLHGHTHIPVAWLRDAGRVHMHRPTIGVPRSLAGQRGLLNPGSVGQPRDGDPEASYMILDLDSATATWFRVPYDIGAVQSAMRAARLPRRLVDRLAIGA